MGMTIDLAIEELESTKDYPASDPASDEALDFAIDTMRKYQKLQADYETRLKADLKAILVDLQLEIEELDTPNNGSAYMDCAELIQQKINLLRSKD